MPMSTQPQDSTPPAAYRYHRLRAASQRFQCQFEALETAQQLEVERLAERTWALESRVLRTPEARDTVISERRLTEACAEVRRRYADEAEFVADLARNGLDVATLRLALQRELIFDAVMMRVGARAAPVTAEAVRAFYDAHPAQFTTPERRTVRHILITINADYPENSREAARTRIEQLAAELRAQPDSFGTLAQRHSECPTALEAGQLGTLPRGRLYPELDAALFALPAGAISDVLESELGFHLLWCERIEPARVVTFEQAASHIRERLEARQQQAAQKDWLARL